MSIAVIPAGGQGKRMGGTGLEGRPKQFLQLGGIPIIINTLMQFEACPDIDQIFVVLPEAEVTDGFFLSLVEKYGLQKVHPPVVGASERQGSVYCGLKAVASLLERGVLQGDPVVSIHDAVRPLVTPELISKTIAVAAGSGAALCATAATDTIKEVEDGEVVATIARTRVYLAQTPQSFRFSLIFKAHQIAEAENIAATDDSMLVENLGIRVKIVEGVAENMKITKPADLQIAEKILLERAKGSKQ
ncbi:MAG: 2-C-methyl-D-erythritol 4-phosphate cytidylyltransferase [Blastocatellia bacterium]|nr:2-C-methyl-D-erythritol 4-phosphate cytidylyltransferase [Blastocatellia bacterium]